MAYDGLPEGPVMLAVGLNVAKIETKTLGDIKDVTEVQTDGVEQHRGHTDFIHGPNIVAAARVIRLPPAKLHAKFTSTRWELDRHDPVWWGEEIINLDPIDT